MLLVMLLIFVSHLSACFICEMWFALMTIFKEEVFDLIDQNSSVVSRADGVSLAKPAVRARVPIQIRETMNGGIQFAGVTKVEVRTKEEMTTHLSRGFKSRATRISFESCYWKLYSLFFHIFLVIMLLEVI
jgi:hypothetical protein